MILTDSQDWEPLVYSNQGRAAKVVKMPQRQMAKVQNRKIKNIERTNCLLSHEGRVQKRGNFLLSQSPWTLFYSPPPPAHWVLEIVGKCESGEWRQFVAEFI